MGRATTKEVMRELRRVKRKAAKMYAIDRMFLFGSRARGDELLTSDVDLIVVSSDFKDIPFRKRPDFFLDLWTLPVDFEVLCYSPDEIERKKKELGLVREALKQAKEI
jgi:predicted nucleotidyltransferase